MTALKLYLKEENKMSVKVLLREEIEKQLGSLEDVPMCSDESKIAIDGVTKLMDRLNEMERIELERQDKIESRAIEEDLKIKQMDEERKDHIVKNCLTAVSIIGGFALTVWGTCKSIEFEKEGTITTIIGRGFINKLLPKK